MTEGAKRYALVHEIVGRASEIPADARSTYLDEACGDDAALRGEVEEMLDLALSDRDDLLADERIAGARLALDRIVEAARAPEAPAPETVDRYAIQRQLGQGGMGIVYQAIHADSKRSVALKILKPGLATDAMLRRFRREVRILGQLRHPGIAQILDSGASDQGAGSQPYLAMELVTGKPIDEYARENRLDVPARLELVARIADALHHAHEKGVIHRDLKPSNILVEPSAEVGSTGQGRLGDSVTIPQLGQPKLLDFGVARVTEADLHTVTLQTAAGQLVGTVPYMSPEQASGDPEALDRRSDVYALGVIAFELLAGCLPYGVRGKLVHEAVRVIREDEPSHLGTLDSSLRGDVETIVAKALEKDPERRYPTAAELAEDLRRHVAHLPIHARPPSTLYQLKKFARRNKALVGGIAGTLCAALIGAAVAVNYAFESQAFAEEARERADQLARVSEFQARQLEGVDVLQMGSDLRDRITRAALATGGSADAPSPEESERRRAFKALLTRVNFTDVALENLDAHLFSKTLRDLETQFEDQPLVEAQLLESLASTMRELGLLERAETPCLRALELRREVQGEEHPETIAAMGSLGWSYLYMGRLDKAEPLLRRALEAHDEAGTTDDEAVNESLEMLAYCLYVMERFDEAAPFYRRLYERKLRAMGPDHPKVLEAQTSLFECTGDFERAEVTIRAALETYRRLGGDNDLATLIMKRGLADILLKLGRAREAESLAREALEGMRDRKGEQNAWYTLYARSQLGRALLAQRRWTEAEELLRKTLPKQVEQLSAEHPETRVTRKALKATREARDQGSGESEEIDPRAVGPAGSPER